MDTRYNGSGYYDKTAAEAINNVNNVSKKEDKKAKDTVRMVHMLLDILGFELVGEFRIKNKVTGKVYKKH